MRRSLLALCTLLLVSSIALPAIASPQPQPVCGPCGTGFENAADREDIELTVIESTATVQIHDDGSATWRVTNTLQNESSAASLRTHSKTLDTIVTYAIRRSSVDGPTENRSARVEGETVVLTFEDRDATTEVPGGVHVVDYLHSGGADSWSVLTADRFTVTGPEGTTVTTDPPGATVTGRNATWHGNGTAKMWDVRRLELDGYGLRCGFARDGRSDARARPADTAP
ncbi:MAG: hypothetical protein V5A38_06180 [Halolamina sp.]|uniref:hypothetical protein n=1 Tax=Halolamina sp. TaxID=1940283 RepID=UPI002FC2FD96